MILGLRGAAPLIGAMLLASCASRPELPELPRVDLANFLPAIRGEVEKAFAAARTAPPDAGANGRLGMVLQAYDQHEAAAVCYTRAHLLDPKSFDWIYYRGVAEAAQGRNAQAMESLRKALNRNPTYLPARLKLAELLLSSGDLAAGGTEFKQLVREHPESATAFYGLGRVQSSAGKPEEAIRSFERACELFPAYGAAHYALALAYRRSGDSKQAGEHLGVYEKNKPNVPPEEDPLMSAVRALNEGAVAHVQKGIALEAAGRLEEAVVEHERAIEVDPKHAQAHVNLISLYGRLGRAEKAEEQFRAAVALNPSLAEAYYNYGVLLVNGGRMPEAKAAFEKATEVNPLYAEAHLNLGLLLERAGDRAEALGHYRKAAENKPNYRQAHFHIGRILVLTGSYRQAIDHLSRTLKPEDGNTPAYLYALASAYARAGNRDTAVRYALQAREQATALGQTRLVASIDRDLGSLRGTPAR